MLLPLVLLVLQERIALVDWHTQRPELGRAPARVQQDWLAACLDAGKDPLQRAAALEIYSQVGTSRHLRHVLDLLIDDPIASGGACVRSIAKRDPESISRLLEIAEYSPLLRAQACAFAGELAQEFRADIAECEPKLLRILEDPAETLPGEAVLLAGRLRAGNALSRLVELLSAEREGLRRDAHWSLQRITGLRLPASTAHWAPLVEREQRWWSDRSEAAFTALESDDPLLQQRALKEIGERYSRRQELVAVLEGFLEHAADAPALQAKSILSRWQESTRKEIRTAPPRKPLRPRSSG